MDVVDELSLDQIAELGRQAAFNGNARSSNPYSKKSDEREFWLNGWYQAVNLMQDKTNEYTHNR